MPSSTLNCERKFKNFLRNYDSKKGGEGKITHTRIPKYYGEPKDKDPRNIYGGSWIIPKDKMDEFHELYYEHVFTHGKNEYLTEAQNDNGQILIDLDFHYSLNIQTREDIYRNCDNDDWRDSRKDQIISILEQYLDVLKSMLEITEEFPVYIFEKNDVVMVPDKKITKDGLHIVIGISLERRYQKKLRELVLENIQASIDKQEFLIDLPNVNNEKGWSDVLDNHVSAGESNWQMLGSKKPENSAYQLVYGYIFKLDDDDTWTVVNELDELLNEDYRDNFIKENFVNLGANGIGISYWSCIDEYS